MTRKSSFYTKSFCIGLLILAGHVLSLYSQDKKISGIINIYKRVEAIGSSPNDNVTLNDVTNLVPGDTVLIMQMKGSSMLVVNDNSYGTPTGYFGAPGMNEFLIIESIAGLKVTFTSNLLNAYNTDGSVQLIKVPYYNTATVTSTLTCQPWDSVTKTGGVLVLMVGRTLSLEADIDVSGKGFIGGQNVVGLGNCASVAGMNEFYYDETFNNSGFKGEGVANRAYLNPLYPPLYPGYSKGVGANLTGGGGGNGRFSGGGGGANWGVGGKGGAELGPCSLPRGGEGGWKLLSTDLYFDFENNFYMGGGGGGPTHDAGVTTSTSGANGGGIVIIVCDTLKGNGKVITAAGGSPNTTHPSVTGLAGAGGGGGGGSIAIYLQSFSQPATSTITLSVQGGKGGNTANIAGEGGGGGGGLILTNNISAPGNVTKTVTGGQGGTRSGGTGLSGSDGGTLNTFSPSLNGFLYNSIRSVVTGDQIDSICSNVPFGVISGTIPFGGTFQWQKTTVANPSDADFADISGATAKDYSPGLITQTTWFRRVVTKVGTPTIVDKSKPVKIIVQPFIKNNIIGNPDTICYAQNPPAIVSKAALQDGNGIYYFKWEKSTDNTSFTDPLNNDSIEAYTPEPALTLTSYYRRTVTSGRCVDVSSSVKITVLDTIKNNRIFSPAQDICYGMTFTNLTGSTPSTTTDLGGGDGLYKYMWISSINGSAWAPASGTNNSPDYDPAELPERAPKNEYQFMRIVKSGMHDVCADTTAMLILRDYPVITNNKIVTGPQNICSGSAPSLLTGSDPLNGDGTYIYIWQDSSKARPVWTDIAGATQKDYQPPVLSDTTSYRRKVTSSACSDISKSVRVNVHKPLVNNVITLLSGLADTTICNGADPRIFKGSQPSGGTNIAGDYAYEWQYSTDNAAWNAISTSGTGRDYDPPSLNVTTYFRRKVLSGACIDISAATLKVEVLPLITNNTVNDPAEICKDAVPALITATSPAGGDGSYIYYWEQSIDGGSTWTGAAGVNNDPSGNYQPPALSVPTKYKRKVTSGAGNCCTSISNIIEVQLHTLPTTPAYAGENDIAYSPFKDYTLEANKPNELIGEVGEWFSILGSSDFQNRNLPKTKVYGLEDSNIFVWKITNGPCISLDTIEIKYNNMFIPEGFSPNDDGTNDYFEIRGLDTLSQEIELSIVNSAGSEVFHTTNKNKGEWKYWDGKNSKGIDLPEGTYYYILKIIYLDSNDNEPEKRKGFIVLKRR